MRCGVVVRTIYKINVDCLHLFGHVTLTTIAVSVATMVVATVIVWVVITMVVATVIAWANICALYDMRSFTKSDVRSFDSLAPLEVRYSVTACSGEYE